MSKARTDILEQAQAIRSAMNTSTRYMPDDVAFEQPKGSYDAWSGEDENYELNDIRVYGDELYRCITAHTSQADWTPGTAVSLWVRISDPAEEWPEWIQPLGAHDAYAQGAEVSHDGKHWTSDINASVYEPGVYGWTGVVE